MASSANEPKPDSRPVRVLALMNQKGGVGKTTTAVNLAAGIAALGRDVLLVDLDPQAHATLHVGVDPESVSLPAGGAGSVYDVLVAQTPAELDDDQEPGPNGHDAAQLQSRSNLPAESAGRVLAEALRKVDEHLWLLPSETDLAAVETELASVDAAERTMRLKRALETVRDRFEFIILDCPPSLGVLTLNALAAAREVFIPMQAHFLALQGVGKLLETVKLVAASVNPRLKVTGVVLCMHDPTTTHAKEVVADLVRFFDQARQGGASATANAPTSPASAAVPDTPWRTARLLSPPIRRNIKLAECPSFGQTIFQYAPSCPGALDYRALAERVVADWDAMLARRSGGAAGAAANASANASVGPSTTAHVEAKPLSSDGILA